MGSGHVCECSLAEAVASSIITIPFLVKSSLNKLNIFWMP